MGMKPRKARRAPKEKLTLVRPPGFADRFPEGTLLGVELTPEMLPSKPDPTPAND